MSIGLAGAAESKHVLGDDVLVSHLLKTLGVESRSCFGIGVGDVCRGH